MTREEAVTMERSLWLKETRRLAEQRMDTRWAPIYDENWGASISPTHQQFIHRFLDRLPRHSSILDAACGTGKYWPMLLEQGHTVLGIDQSRGMLSRARAKSPEVQVGKVGLQEMRYVEMFDGVICMDAMEMIFPEDWAPVLGNFNRALRPEGHLYFTVEIAEEEEIEKAFHSGRQLGLPIVYGEWAHEGGYHYYPRLLQVKEWVRQARFTLMDQGEGDGYYHFLAHKGR